MSLHSVLDLFAIGEGPSACSSLEVEGLIDDNASSLDVEGPIDDNVSSLDVEGLASGGCGRRLLLTLV